MMAARLIAIGDVHGCATQLRSLLDALSPRADDTLVFLGDYVDRGPDTPGVIDQLLTLRNTCRVIAIRGNHDQWMLEVTKASLVGWLSVGGYETIEAYCPGLIANWPTPQMGEQPESNTFSEMIAHFLRQIPPRHLAFLEETRYYHREHGFIFVHAGLDPLRPLTEQTEHDLLMGTGLLLDPPGYRGCDTVVFGHKDTRKLRPDGLPLPFRPADMNVVGLDTSVYDSGVLTAMDVMTGQVWSGSVTDRTGSKKEGNETT